MAALGRSSAYGQMQWTSKQTMAQKKVRRRNPIQNNSLINLLSVRAAD